MLFASKIADLSIHGHCLATAGLESALCYRPTILLDRENFYDEKIFNFTRNNIVFNNWDSLNEIMKIYK